jgi:hypothetical protein
MNERTRFYRNHMRDMMGGYGSTRWGWRSTRATTGEFLALDVRALARRGYFTTEPGAVVTGIEAWSYDGEEVGRVGVRYCRDDPHVITLEYRVRRPDEDGYTVQERVGLDRTRYTFGGLPWFLCPGCGTRRAMLFCVGGLFRCRVCHDLAYRSTREPSAKRARRYGGKLHRSAEGKLR